jgi:hypothetical protein
MVELDSNHFVNAAQFLIQFCPSKINLLKPHLFARSPKLTTDQV